MTECRRYLVTGRVQGVFYRGSAEQEANRLGLTGWVRNLDDGRVEAVACGSSETLAAFEAWLKRGPRAARVEAVAVEPIAAQAFTDFRVR